MSILEKLYYNDLTMHASLDSKKPNTLTKKMNEAMDQWKSRLTKEEYDQLIDLLDIHNDMHNQDTAASFVHGFKLGASVMLEVLDKRDP